MQSLQQTNQSALISLIDNHEKKKQTLLKTIAKKRKELITITAKVEMLRMDLDIVKREYDVRIGKLYLKDDQLDLEILRYKRIKSLLEKGVSFEKALKQIDAFYKNDQEIFDMKYEEILKEETQITKRKQVTSQTQQNIKKLWKKLLFQLHPDLTSDETEKKEVIVLTKSDLLDKEKLAALQKQFKGKKVVVFSQYDKDAIEEMKKLLKKFSSQ